MRLDELLVMREQDAFVRYCDTDTDILASVVERDCEWQPDAVADALRRAYVRALRFHKYDALRRAQA